MSAILEAAAAKYRELMASRTICVGAPAPTEDELGAEWRALNHGEAMAGELLELSSIADVTRELANLPAPVVRGLALFFIDHAQEQRDPAAHVDWLNHDLDRPELSPHEWGVPAPGDP